jgi:hypothetical protein
MRLSPHPMRSRSRLAQLCRTQSSAPLRLVAVFAAVAAGCLGVGLAAAHVDVDVGDGQYVMEIGFRDEPAYVGQANAIFIHVEEYGTGGTEPVDGLAATLTAEVSKDGQSLQPPLVPTGDGSYEGAIGEATVDESVTSSPTTFDSVQPLTAIEFPPQAADGPTPTALAQSAQAEAATARMFAFAGIALGALGLVLAVVAWLRAGNAPAAAPESAQPIEPAGKLIK